MAIKWTKCLEREVIRLKEDEGMSWDEVADALGFDTKHQARIRYNRLKGGHAFDVPEGECGNTGAPQEALSSTAAEAEDMTYEIQAAFIQNDYSFDGETYHFPVANKVVKVPRETWERIIALYSGEGANEVQAAIARTIGMHKKVLEACLRAYGMYKTNAPVTREALAEARTEQDLEPLYEKAIEVREGQFIKRLNERKLRRLESENRRLNERMADHEGLKGELRDTVAALVADFPAFSPLVRVEREPGSTVLAMKFDAHFGMNHFGGWGGRFTTDTAARYFRQYVAELVAYLEENPAVSNAVLVLGGDIFHAMLQQTKKGTPLERDRPDRLVFRAAFAAIRDGVRALLRTGARVDLRVIPGNHDHIFAELLEETLAAHFDGVPGVTVPNEWAKRKYVVVGDAMHVFDHGEGFERLAWQQFSQAELIARMTGRRDFFRVQRIYLYVGHTHHLEMKAHAAHLEIVRVPHAAHTNEYEEGKMHAGEPQGVFFRLDAAGRMKTMERVYFADDAEDEGALAA